MAVTGRASRVRVQLDMSPAEVGLIDVLEHRFAFRSRADLLQQAFGSFLWIASELLAGRRVVSVEPDLVEMIPRFRELSLPAVALAQFGEYAQLAPRPETGRRQPYLKGRNLTVGQLVYRMRANDQDISEVAEDLDLPISQVREAVAYYEIHRDLVDGEMAEDGRKLRESGIDLEPGPVPR